MPSKKQRLLRKRRRLKASYASLYHDGLKWFGQQIPLTQINKRIPWTHESLLVELLDQMHTYDSESAVLNGLLKLLNTRLTAFKQRPAEKQLQSQAAHLSHMLWQGWLSFGPERAQAARDQWRPQRRPRRSLQSQLFAKSTLVRRHALNQMAEQSQPELLDYAIYLFEHDQDRLTRLIAAEIISDKIDSPVGQAYLTELHERLHSATYQGWFNVLASLRLLSQCDDWMFVTAIKQKIHETRMGITAAFHDSWISYELTPSTFWALGAITEAAPAQELLQLLESYLCQEEGDRQTYYFRYLILRLLEQSPVILSPDILYQVIRTELFHGLNVWTLRLLNKWHALDTPAFWRACHDRRFGILFEPELKASFLKHAPALQESVLLRLIAKDGEFSSTAFIGQTWLTPLWAFWTRSLERLSGSEHYRLLVALITVSHNLSQSLDPELSEILKQDYIQGENPDWQAEAVQLKLRLLPELDRDEQAQLYLESPNSNIRLAVYQTYAYSWQCNHVASDWLKRGLKDTEPSVELYCAEVLLNHYYQGESFWIPEYWLMEAEHSDSLERMGLALQARIRQLPEQTEARLIQARDHSPELLARLLSILTWQFPNIGVEPSLIVDILRVIWKADKPSLLGALENVVRVLPNLDIIPLLIDWYPDETEPELKSFMLDNLIEWAHKLLPTQSLHVKRPPSLRSLALVA